MANTPSAEGLQNELGFEQWYVETAFDYANNPIGCRDCGIARKAWHAALEASRTATPAEGRMGLVPSKLAADLQGIANGELPDGDGVDTSVALWAERWLERLATSPADPPATLGEDVERVLDWLDVGHADTLRSGETFSMFGKAADLLRALAKKPEGSAVIPWRDEIDRMYVVGWAQSLRRVKDYGAYFIEHGYHPEYVAVRLERLLAAIADQRKGRCPTKKPEGRAVDFVAENHHDYWVIQVLCADKPRYYSIRKSDAQLLELPHKDSPFVPVNWRDAITTPPEVGGGRGD